VSPWIQESESFLCLTFLKTHCHDVSSLDTGLLVASLLMHPAAWHPDLAHVLFRRERCKHIRHSWICGSAKCCRGSLRGFFEQYSSSGRDPEDWVCRLDDHWPGCWLRHWKLLRPELVQSSSFGRPSSAKRLESRSRHRSRVWTTLLAKSKWSVRKNK
jgi:hypothetical protein